MNQVPDSDKAQDIFKSLDTASDASAILLAVSLLHHALKDLILCGCQPLTKFEIDGLFNEDKGGPLHTFAARTRMAYALNLIGPHTRDDLNLMRKIRNTVAHSQGEITFDMDPLPELSCKIGMEGYEAEKPYARGNHAKRHFTKGAYIVFLRLTVARLAHIKRKLQGGRTPKKHRAP
jgi:DNA-binding MltR family transcriptional regulator